MLTLHIGNISSSLLSLLSVYFHKDKVAIRKNPTNIGIQLFSVEDNFSNHYGSRNYQIIDLYIII